jgi:hypothetical protein
MASCAAQRGQAGFCLAFCLLAVDKYGSTAPFTTPSPRT